MYVAPVPRGDDEPQPSTSRKTIDEMIDKFTHLEKLQLRTAVPQIRLSPLPLHMTQMRTPSNESLASSARVTSTNDLVPKPQGNGEATKTLLELQKEAAQHDIKLKQAQRQNEEERMEFEREIYRNQLNLLELNIRKANLEIDALQGNGNNHFARKQMADKR